MDELLTLEACTLPTEQRPLRLAEFDELCRRDLLRVHEGDGTLHLTLGVRPGLRALVEDLTARETRYCSFFTFTLTEHGAALGVSVTVPPAHRVVLAGLARRARGLQS